MSSDTAVVAAINQLRKDRKAVILAHYYQSRKFMTSPISSVIPWSSRARPRTPTPK